MVQRHKLVTALISLLVAAVLWLYVVSSVAPETTGTVGRIPVTIDGVIVLEERGLVITNQLTTGISLELRTSRVNFSKLSAENIRISADASKLRSAGTYELSYTITFPDTVNSNDIDILRKSSATVTVTVAQLETKKVPVRLDWTGSVKEGWLFEAENAVIDPLEVTLTGPDYELDPIEEAVVSYDISELDATTIETLPLSFVNAAGEAQTLSDFTTASATEAAVTLPILATKQIELKAVLVPGGGVQEENAVVTYDPETIRVKGTPSVIESMDESMIVGSVNLGAILDEEDFSFSLVLPAGVTNMSGVNSVQVHVQVSGVMRSQIAVSDIRLTNAPNQYQVEITNRSVDVTVRGSESAIEKLRQSPGDLYVVVDMSSYTQTGAFTVPGRVVLQNHPELGVVDEVEIGVHISQPRDEESPNE